jgi:FtsZ-binding cell division protein ZapB
VLQQEYQLSIDRLRKDNEEMTARIRDLEKQRQLMESELHQLNTEKGAWIRVEQGLKDRIHSL